MSHNLSPNDESLLMSSVKEAVELVDERGFEPNEAFRKVAREHKLTPGMIDTACHAFNTGRQLAQWGSNDNVLDKLASFPLADPAEVVRDLFGEKEKQASFELHDPDDPIPLTTYHDRWDAADRTRYASVEKQAEAEEPLKPALDNPFDQACMRQRVAKRALDEAQWQAEAAEAKLAAALERTRDYFRKSAYDREPLGAVEFAARVQFGPMAQAVFDTLAGGLPKGEKRAAELPLTWEGFTKSVDYAAEPYTSIEAALGSLDAVYRQRSQLKTAEDEMKLADAYFDRYKPQPPSYTVDTLLGPVSVPIEKDAVFDISDIFAAYGGKYVSDMQQNRAEQDKTRIEEHMQDFDDASHVNEMRKIRAQTSLAQLMSDPDDPISQANPNSVLSAYNSLIHLAPRLADQPEALGPLIRKRIVGSSEPFEVGEALKLDESLQKTQGGLQLAKGTFQ